jgi:hypothetical protein
MSKLFVALVASAFAFSSLAAMADDKTPERETLHGSFGPAGGRVEQKARKDAIAKERAAKRQAEIDAKQKAGRRTSRRTNNARKTSRSSRRRVRDNKVAARRPCSQHFCLWVREVQYRQKKARWEEMSGQGGFRWVGALPSSERVRRSGPFNPRPPAAS